MDKGDDVIERSKKIHKEMTKFLEDFKEPSKSKDEESLPLKEPSKSEDEESLPFPSVVNENRKWLSTEQNKIHVTMRALSDLWAKKLPKKSVKEINEKYDKNIEEIAKKGEEKLSTLDAENSIKSVGIWRDRVDAEASTFKKICHENEKREKEIFEKLQEKQPDLNEANINRRDPILDLYKQSIRLVRERKEQVKDQMGSNLETPSQMLDSLDNGVSPSDMED